MADEIVADLRRINDEMLAAYHQIAAEHERKLNEIRRRIDDLEGEADHDQ